MGIVIAVVMIIILVLIPFFGVNVNEFLFAIIVPYMAFAIFIIGFLSRIIRWKMSPIPFRIPTTCGQQKSLPWIKQNKLENPSNRISVLGRMLLEVLLFRSLFRNVKTQLNGDRRISYHPDKWLWFIALLFHWSLFYVVIRHLRFFLQPVPTLIDSLVGLDIFRFGSLTLYSSDILLLISVTLLFFRRIIIAQVRYISLPADYFPLILIWAIVISGLLMRYFVNIDLVSVKAFVIGLISFTPLIPKGVTSIFYIHLFLISMLFAYIPFSKLIHMAGIFLSPTRNMANNSRMRRHINPWNYPVQVQSYEEYENQFREVMKSSDIPVDEE